MTNVGLGYWEMFLFDDAEDLIVYAYRQKQKSINCTH